jgi:hypothetical protein
VPALEAKPVESKKIGGIPSGNLRKYREVIIFLLLVENGQLGTGLF